AEEELLEPWILFTDGSSYIDGSEAGLILTNPEGTKFTYALRFMFDATNNKAKYEALIAGLRITGKMELLSAENLVGEASTYGVSAMITTTALFTTFVQTDSVPLLSVADYEFLGIGLSTEIPSPSNIMFEKEELETTPEYPTVD
nr:reverse transcriptase domain-containing protein [Tanacetum cinerariifolium]